MSTKTENEMRKVWLAELRFKNAACVIAEETTRAGDSADRVQIRRADFDDLCKALREYREAMGVA